LRAPDDGTTDESGQGGAAARTGGDGDSSGDGDGDGDGAGAGGAGRAGSGSGGYGGQNSAGNGSAGMTAGSPPAGSGGWGAAGAGTGGAGFGGAGAGAGGVSGFSAGQAGVSGFEGSGQGGYSGMAGQILNPQGCDTPYPFVLSIDPVGTSGSVRGWLESTAGLVFEDQLPRFVRGFDPSTSVSERAIALWWSIASVGDNGQGSLYFYAGDFTSSPTQIAVAYGVSRLDEIDFDALDFNTQTVEAQTGSILVFRNASTGETVGLHMDQIIAADPDGDSLCAAVDASWLFLL